MHLGAGLAKPARRKRLPKTAQLAGPAHNISRLHRLPRDCQELFEEGERQSGLFQIQPQGSPPFLVNCKMTSDGGWTVIQRRQDGSVDFNQPWEAYKAGFGDPQGGCFRQGRGWRGNSGLWRWTGLTRRPPLRR